MNNKSIFENPNLVEAINNLINNYTPDNVASFERENLDQQFFLHLLSLIRN